jgi:uroporphyrinogen decarboxylase
MIDQAFETLPNTSKPGAMLAVMQGERQDPPPAWLMRQAGRYLPEYRALRAEKGGFLELCMDSAAAAEVTLQPIRRFGFDAAILFSDILIVPYAMGQQLWFETGEGPRLAPRLAIDLLADLTPAPERFDPVYETVRLVRAQLDPGRALLGFAGSPWTVATYMVDGQGSKDHGAARRLAYGDPAQFQTLIDAIIATTVTYLIGQIDAGVDAVQLFDSWAGSLAPDEFGRWVIAPNRTIVERVRAARPGVAIIGFPKGAGAKLADYAREVRPDLLGLDETVDPVWADSVLPPGMPVQGNLDPLRLVAGGDGLDAAVLRIRYALANRPHVFNLGHGILPDTPIAHVERLIAQLRMPLA